MLVCDDEEGEDGALIDAFVEGRLDARLASEKRRIAQRPVRNES